jgi:8-oxo-dGTP pyrophosphatase MutT (NUDIX family)
MANFKQLISLNEEKQEMGYGAGVCIFCPKTGRFLLQKRGPRVEDPGEHDWFGGGVDKGEDILEGAIRELREEGGIKALPESLYPLARFGYQPEKGLGGYFIWLLVVAEEFDAIPNWDGDAHDEVEDFNWIGAKEWGSIKPHERVSTLFSDPAFVETLKRATQERIDTGHVAKLQQGKQQTNEDWAGGDVEVF